MAYANVARITIDHTKCGTSDSANFPFMFAGIYPPLKTVANGGYVNSSSGYDIGFFTSAALTTKLDWEIEYYDGPSGAIVAWVRLPSLSHTADTVLYIGYGDATISTFQGNLSGLWLTAGYLMALHFGSVGGLVDSSGNAVSWSNTGGVTLGAATGVADGGATFSTGNYLYSTGAAGSLALGANWQFSAWFKSPSVPAGANNGVVVALFDHTSSRFYFNIGQATLPGGADHVVSIYLLPEGQPTNTVANNSLTVDDNTWHKLDVLVEGGSVFTYVDGGNLTGASIANGSSSSFYDFSQTSGENRLLGYSGSYSYLGVLDEVRFGPLRSGDWITAELNNIAAYGTFIKVDTWARIVAQSGDLVVSHTRTVAQGVLVHITRQVAQHGLLSLADVGPRLVHQSAALFQATAQTRLVHQSAQFIETGTRQVTQGVRFIETGTRQVTQHALFIQTDTRLVFQHALLFLAGVGPRLVGQSANLFQAGAGTRLVTQSGALVLTRARTVAHGARLFEAGNTRQVAQVARLFKAANTRQVAQHALLTQGTGARQVTQAAVLFRAQRVRLVTQSGAFFNPNAIVRLVSQAGAIALPHTQQVAQSARVTRTRVALVAQSATLSRSGAILRVAQSAALLRLGAGLRLVAQSATLFQSHAGPISVSQFGALTAARAGVHLVSQHGALITIEAIERALAGSLVAPAVIGLQFVIVWPLDENPYLIATFYHSGNQQFLVDLTGATVLCRVRPQGARSNLFHGQDQRCTILDPAGVVRYDFPTSIEGRAVYDGQFIVMSPSGRSRSTPMFQIVPSVTLPNIPDLVSRLNA
jgi:hypothetical protein